MVRSSEQLPVQGTLLPTPPKVTEPFSSTMGSPERINNLARNRREAAANVGAPTTRPTETNEIAPAGSYIFGIGTAIWPQSAGRGILQSEIMADRLEEGVKVKGLTGYVSRSPGETYLNGSTKKISIGDKFGAYAKDAKRNLKKLR